MRLKHFAKAQAITLVGVVCFVLLAYINGDAAATAPHWLQFLFLYSGLACLTWGLSGAKVLKADLLWRERSGQELLLISGILSLALVLRLWELGNKVRAPVDEVLPMSEILALWENPHLPIIRQFGIISSLTRVYASWQAGSVAIFGHNLLALRIPSAIVGTLTVGVVYFLGRVLFDRKTALVSAVLLATYPPHIHFSRLGIFSIVDPLFGTLAFAFIFLAFKNNQRVAWVLGGVCLGLTQYFYEGGRLVYPAFIIIWSILTLLLQRKTIHIWGRGLLICGFTAVVVAAPIYYTLAHLNDPLSSRMDTLALNRNDWLALLTSPPSSPAFDWLTRHTIDPLLLFINRPDSTPYYGGTTALILIFLVPAFLVGLLWSIKNANGRGLMLWFLVTWAGNVLLVDSALVTHYVVVFPAVALLMAVGILQIASYLPSPHRLKIALVYVAFCASAQTVYYFGTHLENYNQQLVQGRDGYDALFRAADLPSGAAVYLIYPPTTITADYAQTLLRFLSDDKSIHVVDSPDQFDWASLPMTSTYAFFIPTDDTTTLSLLSQYFAFKAPEYSSYPLPKDKSYTLYVTVRKF